MKTETKKIKILLVDDKQANLFALEKVLAGLDVELYKALSGNEALAHTLENDFALILLDVQMPDMDGYEVAKYIHSEERTSHIPIIFITAIDRNDSYEIQGYKTGAVDFMFKPINEDILKSKVEVFLDLYRTKAKLEQSLEHAEAMAKEAKIAEKAKSEFLANMSHEIRTPMNAIIGFSDVLASEKLNNQHREYVDIIRQSGNNLLTLINDILDFSKIEAGRIDIELIECKVQELLTAIKAMMAPKALDKGLQFNISTDNDVPATIHSDPTRLSQCLINLVSNAIKFTDNGHVNINVTLEPENKHIRFSVEDTGIGIAPEKQKTIFESFAQADGSTTRKYGGTGLGLAITKRLTCLLGGSISLSSKEKEGSVFSILIPAEQTDIQIAEQKDILSMTN